LATSVSSDRQVQAGTRRAKLDASISDSREYFVLAWSPP
jgi:hypothetical protein